MTTVTGHGRLVAAGQLLLVTGGVAFLHHLPSALPRVSEVDAWLETTPAVEVAATLVRLAALAAGWYLLAATLVATVVEVLRFGGRLPRLVPDVARSLARGLIGVSATTASVLPLATPAAAGPLAFDGSSTAAARPLEGSDPSDSTDVGPPAVVMRQIDDQDARAASDAPTPESTGDEWVVEPGESFWSIAEANLAAEWGRTPTDAEIVDYWRVLVDANRDRLVVPGNEDLIHPGQRLVVPSTPDP